MTNERPYYDVVVTREDGLWVAVVDGLAGGATDVDRMRDLEPDVRDLIAGLRDLDPEDFEITWHYRHREHDLTPAVTLLHEREQSADEAMRKRDEARHSAIIEMHEAGLSYRTIADLVGMSHQRVQQLASADTSV
ncbi:hypothetical protein GCM10009676_30830 [Prauserella halophila]|uniref:Sigma-70-like protein n=1 Tax=Prauserella halophila TaxID=185641 RepID=A0ABP4H0C2_9PSEU|nr:MerR [Prauserella halophila]MCP2234711.1 hypothetical protein [Prauserella halophila]